MERTDQPSERERLRAQLVAAAETINSLTEAEAEALAHKLIEAVATALTVKTHDHVKCHHCGDHVRSYWTLTLTMRRPMQGARTILLCVSCVDTAITALRNARYRGGR